ncbi:MAG: hypothetical protein JNL72_10355 [Flavipsychrobacter sp.]|nr:hypothetical protein [Flavipsychrobacter sp.]
MLRGQDKIWMHYVKDIIAADIYSAIFLASYLRYTRVSKSYTDSLEVVDLQKYKVLKQPQKVRQCIRERANVPFVFIIGKN